MGLIALLQTMQIRRFHLFSVLFRTLLAFKNNSSSIVGNWDLVTLV